MICADAKNKVPHGRHWHTVMAGNIAVAGGECAGYYEESGESGDA